MIPIVITLREGKAPLPAVYVENSLYLANNLRSRGRTPTETINLEVVFKEEIKLMDVHSVVFYDFNGEVHQRWDAKNREFKIL